jgi:ATP-binding cassette, subfamily B (MDR/TAP), member 6
MVGSYGYLNVLRSYLWLPVSQKTLKSLRVALFEHILNLSLSWHLQRKTGEVLRVVDRGVTSVEHVLHEV